MKKKFSIKIVYLIFIIFYSSSIAAFSASVQIITKVNNEIITNVDVIIEARYLSALNKDLKKLNKIDLENIAKESLIKEKIKFSEIKKNYKFDEFNDDKLINSVLSNFYNLLNIENLDSFKKYLVENNLEFNDIKKKIKIELLWNKLVARLYSNQVYVDKEKIKKDIEEKKLNIKKSIQYDLSEIIFEIKDGQKLEDVYNEILNSINEVGFNSTANKFSISDSAKIGGQIGSINKNQLSQIISDKLSEISVSEITKPIKVGAGYLILKINDIQENESLVDEKQLFKQLVNSERQRQFNQYSLIFYNKVKLNTVYND